MERAIRERMSSVEIDTVMPHDLINAKPGSLMPNMSPDAPDLQALLAYLETLR